MKRSVSALLALLLCLACTISAFATGRVEDAGEGVAGTDLTLYLEEGSDPTFLITIPDSIQLSREGTAVSIGASNVANLDGRRIAVTFGGTQFTANQLVLQDGDQGGYRIVLYTLRSMSGAILVDSRANGNSGDSLIGTELVSFTGNGTRQFQVALREEDSDPAPLPGVEYHGTITYNIALLEPED